MEFENLSDIITHWRESRADKSWEWFATQAGISSNTLKRIWESKTKTANYASARAICLAALTIDDAQKHLESHYPNHLRAIRKEFEVMKQSTPKVYAVNTLNDGFLANYHAWYVFSSCHHAKGVSAEKLSSKGELYLHAAQELVDCGILERKNDTFMRTDEWVDLSSSKVRLDAMGSFLQFVKNNVLLGKSDEESLCAYGTFEVNAETKTQIRDIMADAYIKCLELAKNTENKGSNTVVLSKLYSEIN